MHAAGDGILKRQSAVDEGAESLLVVLLLKDDLDLLRRYRAPFFEKAPDPTFPIGVRAQELERPRIGFGDRRESLALENDLDLVAVGLMHPAENEEGIMRGVVPGLLEELRDDFVRAGKVYDDHFGKVDQRQRALTRVLQLRLDRHPYGPSGWTGDEMRI